MIEFLLENKAKGLIKFLLLKKECMNIYDLE